MKWIAVVLAVLILTGGSVGWFRNPVASPTGRTAARLVVASDASEWMRAQADFRCDGVEDEVEINRAITMLASSGGRVALSEGTFRTTSPIMPVNGTDLLGKGGGTRNNGSLIVASHDGPIVQLADGCTADSFTVEGPGRANLNSVGFELATNNSLLRNVEARNVYAGVHSGAAGTWWSYLDKVSVVNADYGVWTNNLGGTQATIKAHRLWLQDIYTAGISLGLADACEFIDVEIFGNGSATRRGVVMQSSNGGANDFLNVVVDGWGLGAFYFVVPAGRSLAGETRLVNCRGGALNGSHAVTFDGSAAGASATSLWVVSCNLSCEGAAMLARSASIGFVIGNSINPRQGAFVVDGITLRDASNFKVIGNHFSQSPQNHVQEIGTSDFNIVSENTFATDRPVVLLGAGSIKRNNRGHLTESAGTAAIPNAATSIVVNHGLSVTPTAQNISVTTTNNPTNDPGNIWVDTITATQFTVHSRNDPGATGLNISWQAVVL